MIVNVAVTLSRMSHLSAVQDETTGSHAAVMDGCKLATRLAPPSAAPQSVVGGSLCFQMKFDYYAVKMQTLV
jgi:hypothetical protein